MCIGGRGPSTWAGAACRHPLLGGDSFPPGPRPFPHLGLSRFLLLFLVLCFVLPPSSTVGTYRPSSYYPRYILWPSGYRPNRGASFSRQLTRTTGTSHDRGWRCHGSHGSHWLPTNLLPCGDSHAASAQCFSSLGLNPPVILPTAQSQRRARLPVLLKQLAYEKIIIFIGRTIPEFLPLSL